MNTITFELDGKSMQAAIKEDVPFQKLMQAVSDGVAICYDDDGAFIPELVAFAIEYECLSVLTDIELGDSVGTAWKYIRAIDGVPSVDADFIADGIRASISHRNRMVIATVQSTGVRDLIDRLDRIASGAETTFASVAKLLDAVTADVEKNSKVDLQVIADALAKNPMSEERVAKAVLDYQEEKAKVQAKKKRTPSAKKVSEPVKE